MARLVLTPSITEMTAKAYEASDYNYFKFSIFEYDTNTEIDSTGGFIEDNYITFNNLEPDTRYSVYCGCSYDGIRSDITLQNDEWTNPEELEPYIFAEINYSVTSDSISVWLENIEFENIYDDCYLTWYIKQDGSWTHLRWDILSKDDEESPICMVDNLNSDTKYPIKAIISADVNEEDELWTEIEYITTLEEKIIVEKWDWEASEKNFNAYMAITKRGSLSNFHHSVWNDMCFKAKEIIEALGYKWDDTYLLYNETIMDEYDKKLTAARFNSLNYNVNPSFKAVKKADPVKGQYFLDLAEAINDLIDLNA